MYSVCNRLPISIDCHRRAFCVPVMNFAKASHVSKPQLIVRELGNSRGLANGEERKRHACHRDFDFAPAVSRGI
jgi:hypothetical protein